MKRSLTLVLLALALEACAKASGPSASSVLRNCPTPAVPYQTPTGRPAGTVDDQMAEVGRDVPEFAGIYVEPATKSWVVLVHAAMQVRLTDIDEKGNHLTFGVADPQENRECVDAALHRLGIPQGAYVIEEAGGISLLTIRSSALSP